LSMMSGSPASLLPPPPPQVVRANMMAAISKCLRVFMVGSTPELLLLLLPGSSLSLLWDCWGESLFRMQLTPGVHQPSVDWLPRGGLLFKNANTCSCICRCSAHRWRFGAGKEPSLTSRSSTLSTICSGDHSIFT